MIICTRGLGRGMYAVEQPTLRASEATSAVRSRGRVVIGADVNTNAEVYGIFGSFGFG
jgi:hypothetical protein